MIGYIVLVALQAGLGWLGGNYIVDNYLKALPISGDAKIFVLATVFAVVVWIVGVVGSFALKDVRMPSTNTLAWALVAALLFAGLTLVPQAMAFVPKGITKQAFPLVGAILGYMLRR